MGGWTDGQQRWTVSDHNCSPSWSLQLRCANNIELSENPCCLGHLSYIPTYTVWYLSLNCTPCQCRARENAGLSVFEELEFSLLRDIKKSFHNNSCFLIFDFKIYTLSRAIKETTILSTHNTNPVPRITLSNHFQFVN